jgi:hypothetical protein
MPNVPVIPQFGNVPVMYRVIPYRYMYLYMPALLVCDALHTFLWMQRLQCLDLKSRQKHADEHTFAPLVPLWFLLVLAVPCLVRFPEGSTIVSCAAPANATGSV